MPSAITASNLDLDHTGCLVEDLAAGAARWERLGFTLTPLSAQRGAIPGKQGFHPWAIANRCAILRGSYLELIGVVDAHAYNPWAPLLAKNEGLHILALRCENADATHAALSQRTGALRTPVPRERVLDVDGVPQTMRFRNIFSRDDTWPEARYLLIEHQTPEYLWQPRYQQHENGACELVAVTLVANDPKTLVPRLEVLTAGHAPEGAGCIGAQLAGRGSLHVMSANAYADAYGYTPERRSAMHALTVSFRDLARALDLLEKRGVVLHHSPRGRWIGPGDTNGFVMHLVQDPS